MAMDDLLKALDSFNSGLQSLQMSRVMDNANQTVAQIRSSDLDAKQKRNELNNLAQDLTFKLVGLGGSVSAAKGLAETFKPEKEQLPQNEFQAFMLAQGDPEMMDALVKYQKSKAESEALKRKSEWDEWLKKIQVTEGLKDENAKNRRENQLTDMQDRFAQDAFKTLISSVDYKKLQEVTQRSDAISKFEQNPSAFGDIASVFGFMKTIDPESVVRESEYETARNAGDLITQARNWIDKKFTGQQLTDAQRRDLVRLANDMKVSFKENYERTAAPLRLQAKRRKVPIDLIDPMFEQDNTNSQSNSGGPQQPMAPTQPTQNTAPQNTQQGPTSPQPSGGLRRYIRKQ